MSRREAEVLALLAQGLSNKVIARHLGLSPFTVRTHRENLMQKFGAHSVAQLVSRARASAKDRGSSD